MASSSDILTQCPYCQSQFRVTEKQLNAARAKVRCGHCRKVFNAREQALPEEVENTEGDTEDDEEDLILDDNPDEDAEEGQYAGHKYHARPDDEDEFNEAFLNMERGQTPDFHDAIEDGDQEHTGGADERWAESLLSDDDMQSAAGFRQDDYDLPDPTPLESERAPLSEQDIGRVSPPSHPEPDDATSSGPETGAGPQPAARQHREREDPIWASLSSQPIKPPRVDRRPLGRRILWSATVLVAAALLVYQIGWVHYERLALYEPLRPWYATLCSWTGCELPPLQAVDRIKSRELVVRSHPDRDNALLLKVTLVNEAGFDQPYPAIALSFSNLNSDIVAQRVFQPMEYLADAEDAERPIPAGEGRRIRMALRDPGKDAINYRIDLMPSE